MDLRQSEAKLEMERPLNGSCDAEICGSESEELILSWYYCMCRSVNGKPAIKLTTSRFVGAIPIISPMNSKAVGDLIVTGRFERI